MDEQLGRQGVDRGRADQDLSVRILETPNLERSRSRSSLRNRSTSRSCIRDDDVLLGHQRIEMLEMELRRERERLDVTERRRRTPSRQPSARHQSNDSRIRSSESRTERRPERRAGRQAGLRAERQAELRMERQAELRAEQRAELRAEQRAELRAERRAEPRAERRVQPSAERHAEPRAKHRTEPLAERRAESHAEQTDLSTIRQGVKGRIDREQIKQKKYYDKGRKPARIYAEGELVKITKTCFNNDGQSKKLLPSYMGPYRITKVLGSDRYKVAPIIGLSSTRNKRPTTVAADRMMPWIHIAALEVNEDSGSASDDDSN